MGTYDALRHYDAELTVRDYGELLQRFRKPPPDGVLWLVLAPRRYGKTWMLKELEHQLGASARYLDLRAPDQQKTWASRKQPPGEYFLLDELMGLLEQKPRNGREKQVGSSSVSEEHRLDQARGFLSRCAALHSAGTRVILALTPRELQLLQRVDEGSGRVSFKAVVSLPPFSSVEAEKQARTPEARTLLERLPPDWKRTPFLLELIFQLDEQARSAGQVIEHQLLKAVLTVCGSGKHRYFDFVFWDGLAEEHRAMLRMVVRSEAIASRDCEPLVDAGLVDVDPGTGRHQLVDPVLSAELSPLRIHHLSDVHVGPKSAQSIDAKEAGLLAEAVDSGVVREGYLAHLKALHARGEAPHVLILSGDLTEWATKEQCEEARQWLERLAPLLEPHALLSDGSPRILLVGGNHDVDWTLSREGEVSARHASFAQAFAAYPHPHLEQPPKERKLARVAWADLGVEILLLGSSEFGGHMDEDYQRYRLLQEVAKLPKDPSKQDRDEAEKLATRAARIDPGLVHARDLDRVTAHDWREPVRIAVLHHPISPLPSTEVARYAGLLNAGAVKQVLMEKGFCLVLCGHVHAGWFAEERWPRRHKGALRVAAAPSLGSKEVAENNGFNVVEVFRERDREGRRTHLVQVRRFVRQGERSWIEHAERIEPFLPGT